MPENLKKASLKLAQRSIFKGNSAGACALCVFLVLFGSGCMRYSAGAGHSFDLKKIYIPPVKNDSFAPQAQALLTKQIRAQLSNFPNLKIASSPESAAVLEINIVNFEQFGAKVSKNDSTRASSFDITMTVSCTLKDAGSGKIYFKNQKLSDSVECQAFENFQAAKHQLMAQLTRKLADKICEIVCNPW